MDWAVSRTGSEVNPGGPSRNLCSQIQCGLAILSSGQCLDTKSRCSSLMQVLFGKSFFVKVRNEIASTAVSLWEMPRKSRKNTGVARDKSKYEHAMPLPQSHFVRFTRQVRNESSQVIALFVQEMWTNQKQHKWDVRPLSQVEPAARLFVINLESHTRDSFGWQLQILTWLTASANAVGERRDISHWPQTGILEIGPSGPKPSCNWLTAM